jgi:hypothetical protein
VHDAVDNAVLLHLPELLDQHLRETAGIARSRSENRRTRTPKRWNRITSFQRPSSSFSASPTPSRSRVEPGAWLCALGLR